MDSIDANDLTLNKPGEGLLAKADELRAEHPFRSRWDALTGKRTDEKAWRVGADGERRVAAELDKAKGGDPDWHILHGVPVGVRGSDLDHVLVCPAGVFVINSKYHDQKQITVTGKRVTIDNPNYKGKKGPARDAPYVRNSLFEAERTGKLLRDASGVNVPVMPVIVAVGATVVLKSPNPQVTVLERKDLAYWLRAQPQRLDQGALERVWRVAKYRPTWQPAWLQKYQQ